MDSMKILTLGSLFDGSGGFPLGGLLAGITPVWSCEIEPFPIRVTTKRMPFIKHYGDISELNGAELEPVDIITFGSPCQDMSVAGKRSGLDGERSCLFYQAIRIIREMRMKTNGEKPRWICWENVPGAFSSNKGQDFKAVLEAIIGVKEPSTQVPAPGQKGWPWADYYVGAGWSVAYRVLDAQWWGVPQRRARIYLIADFAGQCAPKVLFESEGVSGYSAQSFRAWQRAARNAEGGVGTAGTEGIRIVLNDQGGKRMDVTSGTTGTLRAEAHHPPVVLDVLFSAGFCTEHSAHSRSIGYEAERAPTLRAGTVPAALYENHSQDTRYKGPLRVAPTVSSTYGCGGNNQPFVVEDTPKTLKIRSGCEGGGKGALVQDNKSATLGTHNDQTLFQPKVYGICSKGSNSMKSDNPRSGFYVAQTSRTLDGNGGNPVCNQGGIAVVEPMYAIEGNGQRPSHKGDGWSETDTMYTLNGTEQHGIAAPIYHGTKNSHLTKFSDEPALDTLVASDFKDPPVVGCEPCYIVRRLTPTECARLQGFPDWWCSCLGTEEPTEEEISFWQEVWETHRKVVGAAKRPKSRKQLVKWLKAPHSDAAEYKMWGNGVALPCVWFVLAGIVYYEQFVG